jgi:hypothetical protein
MHRTSFLRRAIKKRPLHVAAGATGRKTAESVGVDVFFNGTMINKKVILRSPKVLENVDAGVSAVFTLRRDYGKTGWSIGVLKKNIKPLAITPVLQYSNTAKLSEIEYAHDGLPSLSS